eukprot:COSAG01_NODE_6458_length_3659_cov_8.235526_1_plen_117_part_00
MHNLAVLLVVLVLLVVVQPGVDARPKHKSRRKKYNPDAFHKSRAFQRAETYMPDNWDGVKVAKQLAIGDMFQRIVDGWPGAKYASNDLGRPGDGRIIQIADFVSPECVMLPLAFKV